MMPDLGKYAEVVIWSYLSTIGLVLGLIVLSVWQARRMKRALDEVESRQEASHE